MKGVLLRWLARYDAWCEEWGLTQEKPALLHAGPL